jgi:hypothetical protein
VLEDQPLAEEAARYHVRTAGASPTALSDGPRTRHNQIAYPGGTPARELGSWGFHEIAGVSWSANQWSRPSLVTIVIVVWVSE